MLATISVTSLADNLNVDGQVTLREAIQAAETDASVDGSVAGSGADTIQFAPGLAGAAELLVAGDLAVDKSAFAISTNITIRGSASGITIERGGAGPEMRMFRVTPSGSLTLESITVAGGFVRGVQGAAPNGAGGEARGGAILNQGTLRIIASTLVNNEVRGGDGIGSGQGGGGNGGAIYNNGGTVRIVNATISSNNAQSGSGFGTTSSFGGGIYSRNGALEIYNSTITTNTSAAGRNVYAIGDGGEAAIVIHSSIIGQAATSPTIFDLVATSDGGGSLSLSGGDNIIRRQNAFSEITFSNDDPLLGPLSNNGGPTHTHALVGGSPAINRGSNRLSVSTDQRGASHMRVMGGQADIGAFEVQTTAGPALPGDYNLNQIVDAADYVIWRKMLGSQVNSFAGADGDGNGRIETQDYSLWRTRFGATGAAAAQFGGPASISGADSPPAGAAAISFDRTRFNAAAATNSRSSLSGLAQVKRPSATSADHGELLNVVALSAWRAPSSESTVWESSQFHASKETANNWHDAGGDGARNMAFELFDSSPQVDDSLT
jgi:CSLREA domain-containing protein